MIMTTPHPNDPASPASLSEKEHLSHIEDGTTQTSPSKSVYNPDVDVSHVDERKLMRKVDARTIPWLSFLYLLAFLDRTSIGNAKVRPCMRVFVFVFVLNVGVVVQYGSGFAFDGYAVFAVFDAFFHFVCHL